MNANFKKFILPTKTNYKSAAFLSYLYDGASYLQRGLMDVVMRNVDEA